MNKLKKYSTALGVLLIAEAFMLTPIAKAENSVWVRNHQFILSYTEIRAGECSISDPDVGVISSLTPFDTPLYNRNDGGGAAVFCDPVKAPDGHHMTLGEFKTARARAWLRCINCPTAGTRSVLHFTGLVPNGTYTVWLFVKNGSGGFSAIGALGTTMPIENIFTANSAGEGRLAVTTPAENLSATMTPVDSCFLDTPFELHLVYHLDNQTHGNGPGPNETWITVGTLLFP